MSTVTVERSHNLDKTQLRQLGNRLADKLTENLGGQCHWQGNQLYYKQSGVSAVAYLQDESVKVVVELGILMSGFSGRVEAEIGRLLDQQLVADG